MNAKEPGRRRFLKGGVALAGLAVGAVRSATGQTLESETPSLPAPDAIRYGVRSPFANPVREGGPGAASTPLQDLDGIITPSALHYYINHRSLTPTIDPRQHRLLIHGMVDRPLVFTLEELKRLPSVTRILFLACAGNSYLAQVNRLHAQSVQETHGRTSCSEWTGVPLSVLLKEAGVQKGGTWLVAEGAEVRNHSMSIPLTKALDDAMVAYSQNGEPVRPEQGFPMRLLLPGWEGTRNVKWLRRIKVVDEAYMAQLETRQYGNLRPDGKTRWFQFELEVNSVITRPSGGQRLAGSGFYEITGLAWSGGGTIRKVEVSTDGGRTWKDAQLQEPVLPMAHTRFRFPWNWNGQEAVLMSRSTDEWGEVQPSLAELSEMWGVKLDYWQKTTAYRIQHFNAVQPWKVNRDGSVRNAMWEV